MLLNYVDISTISTTYLQYLHLSAAMTRDWCRLSLLAAVFRSTGASGTTSAGRCHCPVHGHPSPVTTPRPVQVRHRALQLQHQGGQQRSQPSCAGRTTEGSHINFVCLCVRVYFVMSSIQCISILYANIDISEIIFFIIYIYCLLKCDFPTNCTLIAEYL